MISEALVNILAKSQWKRYLLALAGVKAPAGEGVNHFSELLISLKSPVNRFMVVSDKFSGVLVAKAAATA